MSEEQKDNIHVIPLETFMQESASQAERIVLEVMQKLWLSLPDHTDRPADFILENGTKCWIKRFSAPKNRDGVYQYGFDVGFDSGPLDHLEMCVNNSGWGRSLI